MPLAISYIVHVGSPTVLASVKFSDGSKAQLCQTPKDCRKYVKLMGNKIAAAETAKTKLILDRFKD